MMGQSMDRLHKGDVQAMVPSQRLVVPELTFQIWAHEKEAPQEHGASNTERDTENGAYGKF